MEWYKIFNIKSDSDFEQIALKIFEQQYANNKVYQKFCDYLHKTPDTVQKMIQIPFLPIEFF